MAGLKRYLLFTGSNYYPCGGWDDFVGDFDTFELAESALRTICQDWWHIVDTHTPIPAVVDFGP